MSSPSRTLQTYGIPAAAGLLLWGATALIGGRTEPWDTPLYWTVAYPAAIVLSGVLGYLFPTRPAHSALTLMFTQLAIMLASGAGLSLLPLGLILLTILSLPAIALASLTAWLRRHHSKTV